MQVGEVRDVTLARSTSLTAAHASRFGVKAELLLQRCLPFSRRGGRGRAGALFAGVIGTGSVCSSGQRRVRNVGNPHGWDGALMLSLLL